VAVAWPWMLAVSFGLAGGKIREAQLWVDYFHEMDAASSAFLVGVSDQRSLERVYAVEDLRTRLVDVLKRDGLSVFAEPRARWPGRTLAEAFGQRPVSTCAGAIDSIETLPDSRYVRISGWISDWQRRSVPRDIVVAGARGRII